LWVIAFHTQYFLGGMYNSKSADLLLSNCGSLTSCLPLISGHFGVDVFFVLSGLLVTHNLIYDLHLKSQAGVSVTGRVCKFFMKRFFR